MRKTRLCMLLAAGLAVAPLSGRVADAKVTDAESASHSGDAAWVQLVETYRHAGFEVIQFNLPVLSHYSYMLASGTDALVVDPARDITVYLDYARKNRLTIRGVFLTHSHADFVAGHIELVKALNVPIYQNAASGAKYKTEPLKDGTTFKVGSAMIKAIETPGHTPDGICAAVYASEKDAQPKVLLTGDMLFIGSVGRPDLLEGKMSAAQLASMGYDSWHEKLSKLADDVLILPAHGAGSLCGAHLSDQPSATLGEQRVANPYLKINSRSEYIAAVLSELPETPQYFRHNASMNREGPEPVDWAARPPVVTPDKALMDADKTWVVDIRDAGPYAEGHVPNSVNIALRGRLETWVGIMVPWGANLVLVGEPADLKEAVLRLHRVGYAVAGVLDIQAWSKAGLPLAKNEMVKPGDLYGQMQKGTAPLIVDVRLPAEWMGLRIGTVVNLPLNRLSELSAKLDPTQPVVTVCNSAYRSSMAVGVLERKGFTQAASMAGGSEAWIAAGLPVFSAETKAAGAAPKRDIRLAERICANELKRLMLDLPGTFDLADVRPAKQFADYSLPGARNVDVADLLNNAAYLSGAGPLIIVDRDGSVGMMIGGILSQKSQRQIKVLYGGMEAYWSESELKGAVRAVPLPSGPVHPIAAPATPAPASPAPAVPAVPKKKSAGC